jgi:ABC-type uncharacterized transport system substrate-binding protein
MWEKLLQFALTYLLDKLVSLITREWDEYKDDKEEKKKLNQKVGAIKNAKTKEEFRTAIRDLSI